MKLIQSASALILLVYLFAGELIAQTTSTHQIKPKKETVMISNAEKNKEIVRQLFEDALNKRNFELAKDLISPEFTGIGGNKGYAAFLAGPKDLVHSFADAHWNLTDLVAENDKVTVRWIFSGTHQNSFTGIPVLGQKVSSPGYAIFRLSNQQVASVDLLTDRFTFLQQMQVLPQNIHSLQQKLNPKKIIFIDRFTVPAASVNEFKQRVAANRHLIETMPGFIEDAAYEQKDEKGNLQFVTIAQWASQADLQHAKEAVQENYRKEGFDMPAMLRRLNITMERSQFEPAQDSKTVLTP
ncbi:SnoaL-like domain-containing protein [Pseudoflavitalea sp. G-6-1-2]|uniref:ester cyclase n=1 Tax=Pseudoflavitalea sp. G-6-1-2 TaxID=2728841 RepID=UPI00146C226C|nr:ester cyclase [Pseudoflavitalea sp. G-6-1-2]NML19556.1 SnoaL-like domain-containing protein [Pseudoflavitalea sp. G-6-1-2]